MGSCLAYFTRLTTQEDVWDSSVQLTRSVFNGDEGSGRHEQDPLLKSFSPAKWESDTEAESCHSCSVMFSLINRRHHCRRCGDVFCDSCSSQRAKLLLYSLREPQRVCDKCSIEAPAENTFVEFLLPKLRSGCKVLKHGPFSLFGGTEGTLGLDESGSCLIFTEEATGTMRRLPLNTVLEVSHIQGSDVGWQLRLAQGDEMKFDSKTRQLKEEWVIAVREASKRTAGPKVGDQSEQARIKRKTDSALKTAMLVRFESAEHRRKENSTKRAQLATKYQNRKK